MISVVIPALNESQTVGSVVEFARRDVRVREVIVVDDGSIDGTPEIAQRAGARVLTSTMLGKGASMEDGLRAAKYGIVLYLDGDLTGLHPDLVERLASPIIERRAEFVKARFTRSAGRVTTLTARPLLRTFFPELSGIDQPLGGIVAARRSLLQRLTFEPDYGVDIGLLIDAAMCDARLAEVDIGHIEHDSHPLHVLGDMAMHVVRALLERAARYGRLQQAQLQEVQEVERQMQAEVSVVLGRLAPTQRLAMFDMDGVLLTGRYIEGLAERTGRSRGVAELLDHPRLGPVERTRKIAALFAGVPLATFEQAAREAILTAGACETVIALRKAGYRVGIVSDSFRVAAETVRRRVFADFSVSHVMRFHHGAATGKVQISPTMTYAEGCREHTICKRNVLEHLVERLGVHSQDVLAVGDGENDICLLRAAGCGVAYRAKSEAVRSAADHVLDGPLIDVVRLAHTCGTRSRGAKAQSASTAADDQA